MLRARVLPSEKQRERDWNDEMEMKPGEAERSEAPVE